MFKTLNVFEVAIQLAMTTVIGRSNGGIKLGRVKVQPERELP
jgi:hypothetical protein